MSILELEHLKHTSSSSNNLSVHSDGSLTLGMLQGNVGIGTSSPSQKLHVESAGANYITTRDSTSGGIAGLICQNGSDTRGIRINNANLELYDFSASAARMTMNANGVITTPNQPSFMVYGGWSYAASTNIWKGFGTVDHNIGGHWNNSIGRFTAPVAGKYMIYATAHHSTVNTYHLWAFLKNGSLGGGNWVQSYDTSGGAATTSKQQVWNLAAGDYLEVASNGTYSNAYQGGYVTVGGHLVG